MLRSTCTRQLAMRWRKGTFLHVFDQSLLPDFPAVYPDRCLAEPLDETGCVRREHEDT
jgi:hypothetical protein